MARLARLKPKSKSEPTIALINVVFLLLVFFLVAGSLNQAVDQRIGLVSIPDAIESLPDDVVSIHKDGRMVRGGKGVLIDEMIVSNEGAKSLRIAPDQDLPAIEFVEILSALKAAGWHEIKIIGERVE